MSELERTGEQLGTSVSVIAVHMPPDAVVAPAGVPNGFRSTGDVPLRQVDVHLHPVFDTEWLEDGSSA